jgi:serine/threonine protein kinase
MISQQPTTPINIEALSRELSNHPDRQFVQYLVQGCTSGFDTGFDSLPTEPLVCKNLQSAMKDPLAVSALIKKELQKGFLAGPFPEIPYPLYRINPVGLAEHKYSKKKRLIVDMSAPHNKPEHPSLNSLIDKESHSLQYVRIDDAIQIIKSLGQNSLLIKTDISDAFKLLPIRPDLWPFHGICWQRSYYFFQRLVLGSRSSPKIFDHLSEAIC